MALSDASRQSVGEVPMNAPKRGAPSDTLKWDAATLRDPHRQPDKAARVQAMFDAVAPTYELVNTLGSFGRDAVWRRRAIAAAQIRPGDVVLDLCCGTGDMLRLAARTAPGARLLVGVDFSACMLAQVDQRRIAAPVCLLRADALRLPLRDGCVDVVTCAFGVRNLADVERGLREIYRVARDRARIVLLEFALPARPLWRTLYRLYVGRVLPLLATLIRRDRMRAYRYLAESIRTFEPAPVLARRLVEVGFRDVIWWPMNFGGVILYRARKAAGAAQQVVSPEREKV